MFELYVYFPSHKRAMAVSISLMFGRLGSVAGANLAALNLENHCEKVFYLSGSSVIGRNLRSSFLVCRISENCFN